jgi:hypothetical protein
MLETITVGQSTWRRCCAEISDGCVGLDISGFEIVEALHREADRRIGHGLGGRAWMGLAMLVHEVLIDGNCTSADEPQPSRLTSAKS